MSLCSGRPWRQEGLFFFSFLAAQLATEKIEKVMTLCRPSRGWRRHLDCKLCIGSLVYLLGIRQSVLNNHNIRMGAIKTCEACTSLFASTLSMSHDMRFPTDRLDADEDPTTACQVHGHKERFYMAKRDLFDQLDLKKFCDDCQQTIRLARTNVLAQQLMQALDMNVSE